MREGAVSSPSRPAWVAREAGLVAGAILVYFAIRNVTAGSVDSAFANADRVLRLEQAVGVAFESGLQAATLGHHGMTTVANWIYIWGHWPVIIGAGLALFVLRRDRYFLLRNALFISGAIGFLLFALFPVAPPRLLGLGFVDTITQQSDAYRALQPPGLTNQFAAFPSLHAGWISSSASSSSGPRPVCSFARSPSRRRWQCSSQSS